MYDQMIMIELSNLVAFGAVFVAGLSALYARWAGRATQRGNEIALHNERLNIYKALLHHRAVLITRGPKYPEEQLWSFYEAVQLSEFYFGINEYEKMKRLFDDSTEILNLVSLWEITKETENEKYQTLVKKTKALHRETRDRCENVADLLKKKLKLCNA